MAFDEQDQAATLEDKVLGDRVEKVIATSRMTDSDDLVHGIQEGHGSESETLQHD